MPALVGAVAIGAPMIIAWRGQAGFAAEVMGLDWPLLVPVAIEGSVLYTAYLAHRAVSLSLPAARYRAMTWALAAVAAGMNLWHYLGDGPQVAVVYAACSLLSILLWELTVGLRGRVRSGRSGAEIRAAAWRRLRYPLLSWQAASIRAARGPACSPDEAWHAAWVDRYGVGPDAPLRERRLAARIVRAKARAEMRAARRGELAIVGGVILGRPLPPVVTHGVTAASEGGVTEPGEGSVTEPVQRADAVSSPPVSARALEAVPEPATQTATAVAIRPGRAAESRRRRRTTAAVRRTIDEHRGELARLLAAGELPADASVRQIRRALGCAQGTAVALAAELAGGAA
ncbi:MAG: DUF2637 domain-containing protein [Actinomycetes bacterium]